MQGDSERLSVGGFPAFICPCLILRSAVSPRRVPLNIKSPAMRPPNIRFLNGLYK